MQSNFKTPNPGRFKRQPKFSLTKLCKYLVYTAAIMVCSYTAGVGVGWVILNVIKLL